MPIQIIRNDITVMEVDAIVNAANSTLLGGGGVDGAIHKAAGGELLKKCLTLGGCKTGNAKITPGYRLPAKYIIHTVGPVWHGGDKNESEKLASCYRSSLELANENGCKTVAFPLISAGAYGYPKAQALKIALDTVSAYLLTHDMTVYIVLFDKELTLIGDKLYSNIKKYIDDVYVDLHINDQSVLLPEEVQSTKLLFQSAEQCIQQNDICETVVQPPSKSKLEDRLSIIDESFSQMLLRKIDEKGMTDAECYKKANVDRRHFSKIKNQPSYKAGKTTVLAFCFALELSLEETKEMLLKSGYALSHSDKFDIIVEYFIMSKNYNLFAVNEALFEFDQQLI